MVFRVLFLIIAVLVPFALISSDIIVSEQPDSLFLDTEVSTNIAFNVRRNDTKTFDVHIKLEGSHSNCVQVAFGRDVNGDCNLDVNETDFILGWRKGGYFIEDVTSENRISTDDVSLSSITNFLQMIVTTDRYFSPSRASFTNEEGVCFTEIGVPSYLFSTNWNFLKVTRRGAEASSEWCKISNDYRKFVIRIR